jgi:ABC-type nitrate/sulfonate/bicarbonate transport system ATPase subunit
MTARPGCIKLSMDIRLERPRNPRITTSTEFQSVKKALLEAIEEESMKSFLAEK